MSTNSTTPAVTGFHPIRMFTEWRDQPGRDHYVLWGARRNDVQVGSAVDKLVQRMIKIYFAGGEEP